VAGHVDWHPEAANRKIRAWAVRSLTAAAIVVETRAKELVSVAGTGTRAAGGKPKGKGGKPKTYFVNVEGKQVRVSFKAGPAYYFNRGGKMVKRSKYTAQYHVDTGKGWKKVRRPKRFYRRGAGGAPETQFGA
jgi:hypothetical protein